MKVLVVGRGGREHALCEKAAASPLVEKVYAAPGNPGMAACAELLPYNEKDHRLLVTWAQQERVGLVIIGPEQPLMEGLADCFSDAGIPVFAPSSRAAQIEGSKSFSKELMEKYGIPTAKYRVFDDFVLAQEYVKQLDMPAVVKADGLAAGKGVVIAHTKEETVGALREMLMENRFGPASAKVVIEEFMAGEEFSLMALVNGELVVPLELAQDHKRAFDGDLGPNTGGMGAYSPVSQIPAEAAAQAVEQILEPVAKAMVREGIPFTGVLYAGLMLTAQGPKVIEFNARFGDPETQVILPRLESDLIQVIFEVLAGRRPELKWSSQAMAGVVLASRGYPDTCAEGVPLPAFQEEDGVGDVHIYYSGVCQTEDGLVSKGGRVYLAGCLGDSLGEAREKVYAFLDRYRQPELFYRTDIGKKAVSQ
ncbi:MAG: phosphoribosylamine--glycine ligase [Firmicutes bacterium]|nr:phosphoribosylamine--glycine ligase [Bacillota bacterium]